MGATRCKAKRRKTLRLALTTVRAFFAVSGVVIVITYVSLRPAPFATHVVTKLRDTTNANGENYHRARQRRGEQRHRDRYPSTEREKFNSHVARVLSDEVDQRNAEEYSDGDPHPCGGRPSMAVTIITFS
jgi:hypothetical protein